MLKSLGLDGCKSNVIICLIGLVCSLRHAKCKSQKVVDYSVSQIKIRCTVRAPLLQFSFTWKVAYDCDWPVSVSLEPDKFAKPHRDKIDNLDFQ